MTPFPRDFERKVDFLTRFAASPNIVRTYSSVVKRRQAGEKKWLQAKQDSLVSVSTDAGEVLLFGKL